MTLTQKGLLTLILVLTSTNAFLQIQYTGYFCTGVNQLSPFKYTREYKQEGSDTFITLYKIYSATNGYYLNITATHYKSEKKIVVNIDDITIKIGGHISTQEITYNELSLTLFGRPGRFKEMYDAQNVLPHELALKFVSNKFENVKIANVSRDVHGANLTWYVLDEK